MQRLHAGLVTAMCYNCCAHPSRSIMHSYMFIIQLRYDKYNRAKTHIKGESIKLQKFLARHRLQFLTSMKYLNIIQYKLFIIYISISGSDNITFIVIII